MKRKDYMTPTIEVVEVLYAQTICTSGGEGDNPSTVEADRQNYGKSQSIIWN